MLDRITTVRAPDGGLSKYSYDPVGNPLTATSPRGGVTSYTYDSLDRPLTITDPLGRKQQRFYTIDGQVSRTINARKGTTDNEYDSFGRLTSRKYSNANTKSVYFTYYPNEAFPYPYRVTDGLGTQSWGWSDTSRLRAISRTSSTPGVTTGDWGYTYNADGTVQEVQRPDGTSHKWTYDAAAQPVSQSVRGAAGTFDTDYSWDPDGQLLSSSSSGMKEWQSWDRAGRLSGTGIAELTGASKVSQRITRDPVGNPVGVSVERGTNTESKTYSFDANDRLQGVCYRVVPSTGCAQSDASQWWAYDLSGNRVSERTSSPTASTLSSSFDLSDRLTGTSLNGGPVSAVTSDPDGNVLSASGTSWTYDANNRALSELSKTGVKTLFARDDQGNVLTQSSSRAGSSPTLSKSLSWDLHEEIPVLASETTAADSESPSRISQLISDPLGRVAAQSVAIGSGAPEQSVLAHDVVGSPTDAIAITGDAARSITASADWSPFGVPRPAVGSAPGPAGAAVSAIGFGGLTVTADSSTLHARDRTYQPEQGRWLSTDPITPPLGSTTTNTFTYANNQPTHWTDPLGTCIWQLAQCGGFWHELGQSTLGVTDVATEILATATNPIAAAQSTYQTTIAAYHRGGLLDAAAVNNPLYAALINADHFLTLSQKGCLRAATAAGTRTTLNTATTIALATTSGHALSPRIHRTPPGTTTPGTIRAPKLAPAGPQAQQIAHGHAFTKHVKPGGQFPRITTNNQFAQHIQNVITQGERANLTRGRTAYWHDGTFVVLNPKDPDGGSAFKPTEGYDYFMKETLK